MSDAKISIRNLYKIFGANPARYLPMVKEGLSKTDLLAQHDHVLGLENVNLEIMPKGIQVVMGLSGSGKSTLIRHINRLIEPSAGEILIDGENVLTMSQDQLRDLRRFKAAMVFQKFALLPHRKVIDNIAYGLIIQGQSEDAAKSRAMEWVERVGLTGFENHYPAALSGGMQQRVGLARALATDAEILLMDEAFSALDPLIRADMQAILLELQQELHKTIVFITHDLDEALRLGDDIAILRDGAVIQQGSAQDIVLRPADDYIRDFTKDINRGAVIKMSSLARDHKNGVDLDDAPRLEGDTLLAEALPRLAKTPAQAALIVNARGKTLGAVTLQAALAALKNDTHRPKLPQA